MSTQTTPARGVHDVDGLHRQGHPVVLVAGALRHGGDLCLGARRRGPSAGWGPGGAGPRPGREGGA